MITRRCINYTAGILLLALLVWGWIKLHDPTTLPLQKVNVHTRYQYITPQELQQIISPYAHNGFFAVDIDALKQRLLALSWVKKVAISRTWPNRLNIRIQPKQAIAIWNNKALLTPVGTLFTPTSYLNSGLTGWHRGYLSSRDKRTEKVSPMTGPPSGQHSSSKGSLSFLPAETAVHLVKLNGPEGQQQHMLRMYHQMAALLAPLGLRIAILDLSPRLAWRLTLQPSISQRGMIVRLGDTNVIMRLQRFVDVYNKVFKKGKKGVKYVDLRYTNGMAVKWL